MLIMCSSGTTGKSKYIRVSVQWGRKRIERTAGPKAMDMSGMLNSKLGYAGNFAWVSFAFQMLLCAMNKAQFVTRASSELKDSPLDFYQMIVEHNVETMMVWPHLFSGLLEQSRERQEEVARCVKCVLYGGSKTPGKLLLKVMDVLHSTHFIQGYGSTEDLNGATLLPEHHSEAYTGLTGQMRPPRSRDAEQKEEEEMEKVLEEKEEEDDNARRAYEAILDSVGPPLGGDMKILDENTGDILFYSAPDGLFWMNPDSTTIMAAPPTPSSASSSSNSSSSSRAATATILAVSPVGDIETRWSEIQSAGYLGSKDKTDEVFGRGNVLTLCLKDDVKEEKEATGNHANCRTPAGALGNAVVVQEHTPKQEKEEGKGGMGRNNKNEDRWYRTGDYGWITVIRLKDGSVQPFLSIASRGKTRIVTLRGAQVYPNEIESHLYNLPGVHDGCVAGVLTPGSEGEDLGSRQEVAVFVVPHEDAITTVTETRVRSFFAAALKGQKWKQPTRVIILPPGTVLPRNQNGKLLRPRAAAMFY